MAQGQHAGGSFSTSTSTAFYPKTPQPPSISARLSPSTDHSYPAGIASHRSSATSLTDSSVEDGPPEYTPEIQGGDGHLRRALQRRHVLMIAMSGTIGIGLFLNSSKILAISGSLGGTMSYALVGLVVYASMTSLAEMVSFLPIPGAIYEYPTRFVDPALGFAVGWMYWLTYAFAGASLTTAAAIFSLYWDNDFGIGGIIALLCFLLLISNILGVKVYGNLEYVVGWLKVILVIGLCLTMLAINRGAGPTGKVHGIEYWRLPYRFPDSFDGNPRLTGALGRFLSVWTTMTMSAFAYVGVELVVVCAGEARYPTRDLPKASRRMWIFALTFYVAGMFFASLNIPWNDPSLLRRASPSNQKSGQYTAYILAIRNAGIPHLPGFVNAAFLFCAATCSMTALYASSRTLYAITRNSRIGFLRFFARTNSTGVPFVAIIASWSFSLFAFLQLAGNPTSRSGSNSRIGEKLLDVFSRLGTTSAMICWMSNCIAFIRFYGGLRYQSAIIDRKNKHTYRGYRSSRQPLTAWFGAISCALLVTFNGWEAFYKIHQKRTWKPELKGTDIAAELIGAYVGPLLFVSLYVGHKFIYKTQMVALPNMEYIVARPDWEEPWENDDRPRWRRFLSWIA